MVSFRSFSNHFLPYSKRKPYTEKILIQYKKKTQGQNIIFHWHYYFGLIFESVGSMISQPL